MARKRPSFGAFSACLNALVNAFSLCLLDLLQTLLQVLHERIHVVSLELILALLTQTLHEVTEAVYATTFTVLRSPAEKSLHRSRHIAIGQQVVGHRVHQVVRVELNELLRAIPARVAD